MFRPLNIAVIGGGISGLVAAFKLVRRGHRVSVFEGAKRVGGWVRSERLEGSLFEWGPNTLMATDDWFDLFRQLNLRPQHPRPGSKRRFIVLGGKLQELPIGPISFLMSSVLSWSSKKRIAMDLLQRDLLTQEDLSLREFALRYLNQEILDRLLQPFVSGIYAGDAEELSLRSCFPKLWEGLKDKGSIIRGMRAQSRTERRPQMVSFESGLEVIIAALSHELGARVRSDQEVLSLNRSGAECWSVETRFGREIFDHVVLSVPAFEVARLLESILHVGHLKFLKSIPYKPVLVWNLLCERLENFPRGFGCLIPRTEGTPLLGSLWRSEIFEGAATPDRVTMSQFFSGDSIPSDPQNHEQELRKWIPGMGRVISTESRLFKRGIPQLLVGHQKQMDLLLESVPKDLTLIGNYIEGVGLVAVMSRIRFGLAPLLDDLS